MSGKMLVDACVNLRTATEAWITHENRDAFADAKIHTGLDSTRDISF